MSKNRITILTYARALALTDNSAVRKKRILSFYSLYSINFLRSSSIIYLDRRQFKYMFVTLSCFVHIYELNLSKITGNSRRREREEKGERRRRLYTY